LDTHYEECQHCGQVENLPWRDAIRAGWEMGVKSVLCPRCAILGLSPTLRLRPRRLPSALALEREQRLQEAARLRVEEHLTLAQIGEHFGVTREAARLMLKRASVDPRVRVRQRQQVRAQEKEAEHAAKLHPCAVCRTLTANKITCGGECSKKWPSIRYHLDPSRARRHWQSTARWTLKHPEKNSATKLRWAKKVLEGTAVPNRRFVVPGSAAAVALEQFGLDFGPLSRTPARRLPYPCAAINLNGQPCKRTAATEDGVCTVHARQFRSPVRRAS